MGGSPPARRVGAEDVAVGNGVSGDGDCGGGTDAAGFIWAGHGAEVETGALTEVQNTVVLGQDTATLTAFS